MISRALPTALILTACAFAAVCGAAAAQQAPLAPGARITLNVVEEDIASVLRLLSESQRVNIIAGPEVTGPVSVNLYEVPFEEALRAILNIAGYSYHRVGDIVYVTTAEQKALLPPSAQDLEVATFELMHVPPQDMVVLITEFLSGGGKALPGLNKTIVVMDDPERIAIIDNLIDSLDQPLRQVLIQVHIITVARDSNLNIGVGFDTLPLSRYGIEALGGGFAQAMPPLPTQEGAGPEVFDLSELPNDTGFFAGTLQNDFRAFLEALDTSTDVEILASPQILVMDGEQARLQVGDRLGFRITTTTETASLESVEFLEVGTVMDVTPNISADGIVAMQINPKVSSGFIDNEGLPSESTTEVSTNMLVLDGQTIVIGGLLNATRQRIRSQIPFLGDIPVVGKLFGRTNWIDDESEVIVFLTPIIVGPRPTAPMTEKVEEAEARWPELEEHGMVGPEQPRLNHSPSKQWREFLRQRGALQVREPAAVDAEDVEATPPPLMPAPEVDERPLPPPPITD